MEILILLFAAYALCFAAQHKFTFLHNKTDFTDRMLQCTFCTAFHTGWLVYLIHQIILLEKNLDVDFSLKWSLFFALLFILICKSVVFGLASSAFSYALDTAIRCLESHSDPIEVEDVDDEDLVSEKE